MEFTGLFISSGNERFQDLFVVLWLERLREWNEETFLPQQVKGNMLRTCTMHAEDWSGYRLILIRKSWGNVALLNYNGWYLLYIYVNTTGNHEISVIT